MMRELQELGLSLDLVQTEQSGTRHYKDAKGNRLILYVDGSFSIAVASMSEVKRVTWKALDSHVIVVAIEGHAGDWATYIGATRGLSHDVEWTEVAQHGSKLSRELAEFLFPEFKDLQYRE